MNKKLIINADDYGICREVNGAIEDLIIRGKLQNISVLANGRLYEEAADFLLRRTDCSVGAHLNIVEGVALSPDGKAEILLDNHGQFVNLQQILLRWLRAPLAVAKAVEAEWRTQIESLLKSGLHLSHADSHQHIHAFPPFWKILLKLCREYKISAVRLPRERNKILRRRGAALALGQCASVSELFVPIGDLAVNNHLLGFKRAGSYGENEMIGDLENLQNGVTEMVVHPSLRDGVPYSAMRGALEYEALSGDKLQTKISESNITLINWTEFSNAAARNQ